MYKDFIAGWVAGGSGLLIGHPLDTIKTRLQTIHGYSGILDCARRTFQEESIFGLYKGLWGPFLTCGVLNSLLFTGYGLGLKLLHPGESNIQARKDLPMTDIILASMCGTMLNIGPAIPVELVKTRLQVQKEKYSTGKPASNLYRGPLDCVKKIYQSEGIRGLFKGGTVFFMRDAISYTYYIPVYELGLRYSRRQQHNELLSQIFWGGTAGTICWWSICPLEVVKNKIQTDKSGKERRFLQVAKQLWKEEGYRAFYRGGIALAVRGFVVNAAVFFIYENVLKILNG